MASRRYSSQTAYENPTTVIEPKLRKSKIYEALAAFEQRRSTPVAAAEAQAFTEAEQVLRMIHDESYEPN